MNWRCASGERGGARSHRRYAASSVLRAGFPARGEILSSSAVFCVTDLSRYGTAQGLASQIPAAYSAMVRSLENFPELATFAITFLVQLSGSP